MSRCYRLWQVAGFAALGQDAALLQHSSRGAAFGYQLAAVAVTVAIGAAGGALGGFLVTAFDPVDQKLRAAQLFEDGTFWTVRAALLQCRAATQAAAVSFRDPALRRASLKCVRHEGQTPVV